MSETELITNLLKMAKEDKDFQKWKTEHPEICEKTKAMTREEKIEHIISLMEELGLIKIRTES